MSNVPPNNQGRSLRDTLTQFSLRATKLEERIRNPQQVVVVDDGDDGRNHPTETTSSSSSSSLSPLVASAASLHWKRRFAELAPALVSLPRPAYDEVTETMTGSKGATTGGASKRMKPDSTTAATTFGSSKNPVAEKSQATNDSVDNDALNKTTNIPPATTNECGAAQPEEEVETSHTEEQRSKVQPSRQPLAIDTDHHPDSDRNTTAAPSSSLFTRELYYKEQIQKVQEEITQIQGQRTQFQTKQLELWAMYMYGLHKITTIGDLGDAPDAILPGNY